MRQATQTILVTGAAGYIGSVLSRRLLENGYAVRAVDNLSFGGESLLGVYSHPDFDFIKLDIRDQEAVSQAVSGVHGVIHLAAIVGDPACALDPDAAEEINWTAFVRLYDRCASEDGIRKFIFASTCSNYGRMEGFDFMNERSALNPVSLYARQKVRAEEYALSKTAQNGMAATALRFSTAYGLSPRMRFDLTVNEFMRDIALGKDLTVYGEQFWRPYCHIEDIANACMLVLKGDDAKTAGAVFGVGDTDENYQKKMIVEEILRIVPEARVHFIEKTEDPRDYRVDFSKIKDVLGFRISKRVPDGLSEVHSLIRQNVLTDPHASIYRNIA
ncbi:SDR family NAD(P)-dependent oxidoreductase [Rhodothermus sp. AH-315-K08]|nr:SDR family NAD(P)-dependent oxidoreductase [Rhodothermus sp. AH-315-K08]